MMSGEIRNILITGLPGIGKTTLIQKVYKELEQIRTVGFFTQEIREKGTRKGFTLESFTGQKGILSHVDILSSFHVGKYRVDISGFEDFLDQIDFLGSESRLVLIDEIGRMECFSDRFNRLILKIMESNKPMIATIALKGRGLISEIKQRHDAAVYEITRDNREFLISEILKRLNEILKVPLFRAV